MERSIMIMIFGTWANLILFYIFIFIFIFQNTILCTNHIYSRFKSRLIFWFWQSPHIYVNERACNAERWRVLTWPTTWSSSLGTTAAVVQISPVSYTLRLPAGTSQTTCSDQGSPGTATRRKAVARNADLQCWSEQLRHLNGVTINPTTHYRLIYKILYTWSWWKLSYSVPNFYPM